MWQVLIKRKLERKIAEYPAAVQNLYFALKRDLTCDGPDSRRGKITRNSTQTGIIVT